MTEEILTKDSIINFRDWSFEGDRTLTVETYRTLGISGGETCACNYCKNYVADREKLFPKEIFNLFDDLGIDFKKEVEMGYYDILPNGLYNIGGWYHFKGKVLTGKDYRINKTDTGYSLDLTAITDNFFIGFADGNELTFF